jgi:hypothetical protein
VGMVKTVGLVLHPGRNCDGAMLTILNWASGRGVTVLALDGEAERVPGRVDEVTPDDLAERSDLMVSLGGDGTMLRAMRLSCGPRPPVLGVNVGKLGFLAEVDPPEVAAALEAIDGQRFTVEPRSAVQADFLGQRTVAFNDVDLARIPGHGSSGVVELTVESHPFVRNAARVQLLRRGPTGLPQCRRPAGHPGGAALGVQPGTVPGRLRAAHPDRTADQRRAGRGGGRHRGRARQPGRHGPVAHPPGRRPGGPARPYHVLPACPAQAAADRLGRSVLTSGATSDKRARRYRWRQSPARLGWMTSRPWLVTSSGLADTLEGL